MSDQLIECARKAAEEMAVRIWAASRDIDSCEIVQGGDCKDFDGCRDHVIKVFADIIERHMRAMTLVELGNLVQQREQWLQKEIESGRWLDSQGELWNPGRLIELEKELEEGCKLIETVMHQYDEGEEAAP